ncbi:MAG: MBL fold metallo-hydrolase [Planctomycetota bacterium]
MVVSIQFLGAARQVTGSRHLLRVGDKRILLDCGLVQGPRRKATRANQDLGLTAHEVDAVVLSHAHIDHSGALPRLVKLGFHGRIHCTEPTADLLPVMLRDSAHLQANDARYLKRKGIDWEPPYDQEDVEKTTRQIKAHRYHQRFEVVPGVTCELLNAGHIFGSAMVVLTIDDEGREVRVGFTGDLGRSGLQILQDPDPMPPVDVLLTEATYGDRIHDAVGDIENQLADIVNEEMADHGRIVVPSFAVGRTQGFLVMLNRLMYTGRIPSQWIWADSPMAAEATKITRRYPELWDEQTRALLEGGQDPFFFEGMRAVGSPEESRALNNVREGIIIASSGMCEGGRVLHHLRHSIHRPEDCVLIVGFMAKGTLGRKLLDGYPKVPILGVRHEVRCRVRFLPGLSAHADRNELLAFLRHLKDHTRRVFVVHAEEDPAQHFAGALRDEGFALVTVPVEGEEVRI